MMTTKEIFDALLSATDKVKEKKVALDKAQNALNAASEDYTKAVNTARNLKEELDEALSAIEPGLVPDERVRISE